MGNHQHTKKAIEDIENTIENLKMIKGMIESHQSCLNVLNQISGVFVRLNETRALIINDHIKSCISGEGVKDLSKVQTEIEQILKTALSAPSTGSFH